MNTLLHKSITLLTLTVLVVSCSNEGDMARGGKRKELTVGAQIKNSDWTTRSGGGSITIDERLEVVSEYESMGSTNAPTTRGVPIGSASGLNSMQISLYTNSLLTNTLKSTNNGYSWDVADNPTLDLDKNKYSYYACSPIPDAKNGIVVPSGGKTLTYAAPDDVKEQPDICRAAPITDDNTGNANFIMQHALTAVGIKVRGDNVQIESIKLTGIHTAGTLDITNGNWTSISTPKDLTFNLQTNNPGTEGGVSNITAANGYFMVPPQSLTDDGKKLIIRYKYSGETEWHTGTYKLSDISGSSWGAGQKVFYVIQLKSKFSLNLERYAAEVESAAGTYTLTYDTNSSNTTLDPQVSYDASWITNMKVTRNGGRGTITFNYQQNPLDISRKAEISVTSGFTTKKLIFTQLTALSIDLSIKTPDTEVITRYGWDYNVNVIVPEGINWKISENIYGCKVYPSTGTGPKTVIIEVPGTSVERTVNIIFSTNMGGGRTEKTVTWSGRQVEAPLNCWYTPIPGYPKTFVYWADEKTNNWAEADKSCNRTSGRLPTSGELVAMFKNAHLFGTFSNNSWYWTSTWDKTFGLDIPRVVQNPNCWESSKSLPTTTFYVRCVISV